MTDHLRRTARRMSLTLPALAGLATAGLAFLAPAAHAQTFDTTLLINNTVPPDFDRGRNVGVADRPRPDYDPLGIRAAGFEIFPRLGIAGGYTDNAFLTDQDRRSAPIISVAPGLDARSDWAVNEVRVAASGVFDQYIGNSARNQANWSLNTLGRLDVSTDSSVTAEAQVARIYESPLSGDIQSNLTVLSNYLRSYGNLRAQRVFGSTRATVAVDYTLLDFSDLHLPDNSVLSQADRNRGLLRGTGQLEYALTPSTAVYGQASYVDTEYHRSLLSGLANRDSNAFRILGGLTLDLAGLLRGRFGIGYSGIYHRAPLYRDVSGFSAEAQIEFFPTELTTFTLRAARSFQDANFGTVSAFIDTRASLRVDHELLTNLILDAEIDVGRQHYIDSTLSSDVYRVVAGARYLASRLIEFDANASFLSRNSDSTMLGQNFGEVRGIIGIMLHR